MGFARQLGCAPEGADNPSRDLHVAPPVGARGVSLAYLVCESGLTSRLAAIVGCAAR